MTLRDDLRELSNRCLQRLEEKREGRKRFASEWERVREKVIRPACEDVEVMAKAATFWTAGFARENGSSALIVSGLDYTDNKKVTAELRFAPTQDYKVECSSRVGEEVAVENYAVEKLDAPTVEGMVRNMISRFFNCLA